jgi:hypothetical protein
VSHIIFQLKRPRNPTREQRHAEWLELGRKLRAWQKMTHEDLLAHFQKDFPAVKEATRDECIYSLVMSQAEMIVGIWP